MAKVVENKVVELKAEYTQLSKSLAIFFQIKTRLLNIILKFMNKQATNIGLYFINGSVEFDGHMPKRINLL